MTYDALRLGRVSLSGYAYFVTTVTADRAPLFKDLILARVVVNEMRRLDARGDIRSLAWTLMPDHLHWLFQLGEHALLAKVMRELKGRSARQINLRRGRQGPVWQRAFFDHGIRENEDIRGIARYIIANPIRAGLTDSVGNDPHWDAVWL